MNSALYSGWVQHRRHSPRAHAFRYRIGLLYLDLDEREAVLGLSPLAGSGRFAPFSFRERDYLCAYTANGQPLAEAARQLVAEALGERPEGPVCLLTQVRSWGLAFNPASFYYCHHADGRLAAILCEVTNTPWRERYHYVVPAQGDGAQRIQVDKAFHVSPFMPRDMTYRMAFTPVSRRLGVHIENWREGQRAFDATLDLTREPLDRGSLHRYLARFPWMTAKTGLAIYWQALRLLIKRTPIFNHQVAVDAYRVAVPLSQEHDHEKP